MFAENIVGKGRKCWKPAFPHFPTMFSTLVLEESCTIWATLKMSSANALNLDRAKILSSVNSTSQSRLLMTLKKKPFKSIVGKGESAGNKHFLLFPQCFLPISKRTSDVKLHLYYHLQMLWVWTSLKICCWYRVNGLDMSTILLFDTVCKELTGCTFFL